MSLVSYSERTFKFIGKLTIYKVSEIKKILQEKYNLEQNKADKFYLDFSEVESIDTSVLQVLIALRNSVEIGKGKIEIKKSCQALDSVLDLLGLSTDTLLKAG